VSVTYVPTALRRLIEERADWRCEYCLLPANVAFFPHEVDHVIAEKHGGATEATNLAFTCWRCNRHKGTDLGSFDPDTGAFCRLFNPRAHQWHDHFALNEGVIIGSTPEGHAMARLLQVNTDERVRERQRLVVSGHYHLSGDPTE